MKLQLKTQEVIKDEAQQASKETNTETNEAGKVVHRDMDYIEKALLQNQKALAMTLTDIQNDYTKTLTELLHTNNILMGRISAMEIQMHGLSKRLAMLQGNGATAIPIDKTGS